MSTPIQHDVLSPDDPKYYAPPKWRSGEIEAPPIQPQLRTHEFPDHPTSAHSTFRHVDMPLTNAPPRSRRPSDELEYKRVRVTAIAIAVGVIVWIGFCISAALGRLDTTSFAEWRNWFVSAGHPEISKAEPVPLPSLVTVGERLQAANSALSRVLPPMSAPTFVVEDVSGIVNAALPLAIKVTNYTPNTTINLSGFVVGTVLSSGVDAGAGRWRVAIDDLPDTRVIPPPDYVGPMTVMAELRGGDDQAIVRTSLRLNWRPAENESTGIVEPRPSDTSSSALDKMVSKQIPLEQVAAPQSDLAVAQPGLPKAGRHASSGLKATKHHRLAKKRRHRNPSSDPELQTYVDPRGELRSSMSYGFDTGRERRPFWTDDLDFWARRR